MQTIKMSLENMEGKLSRTEMKSIMAGLNEEPAACDDATCEAKSSPALGTCACSYHKTKCLCVK